MLIGELADAVGVTSQAIRFYERKGLLPDAERGANGYRVYDESTLARLRFIDVAQAAGLTLSEIRSIIDLRDDGTVPCAHVATLNGALGLPTAVARAVAPWLLGVLWQPVGGYTAGLWVLLSASVVAVIALVLAQRLSLSNS